MSESLPARLAPSLTSVHLRSSWPDLPESQQPSDDTILRHSQLQMRVAEIYRVIESMASLNAGNPLIRNAFQFPDFDWTVWQGAIAADKPIMTGHSLGGSAAVRHSYMTHSMPKLTTSHLCSC